MGNKFSGKARNGSANNPKTGVLLTCPPKNNPKTGAFKPLNIFFGIPIMGDYSRYCQSVLAKRTAPTETRQDMAAPGNVVKLYIRMQKPALPESLFSQIKILLNGGITDKTCGTLRGDDSEHTKGPRALSISRAGNVDFFHILWGLVGCPRLRKAVCPLAALIFLERKVKLWFCSLLPLIALHIKPLKTLCVIYCAPCLINVNQPARLRAILYRKCRNSQFTGGIPMPPHIETVIWQAGPGAA